MLVREESKSGKLPLPKFDEDRLSGAVEKVLQDCPCGRDYRTRGAIDILGRL